MFGISGPPPLFRTSRFGCLPFDTSRRQARIESTTERSMKQLMNHWPQLLEDIKVLEAAAQTFVNLSQTHAADELQAMQAREMEAFHLLEAENRYTSGEQRAPPQAREAEGERNHVVAGLSDGLLCRIGRREVATRTPNPRRKNVRPG